MENPGTLLRRAKLSRRFRIAAVPRQDDTHAQKMPPQEPPHQSSHANYTALMRSHDRMRTRHIGGQGGGNGA